MIHKIPDFEKGIKIESVGMYLEEIRRINENRSGDSTELFFRGQEAEFWNIEPSIFREDMLSIEHKLMLTPLQKVPMEFRSMQDTFEIMTKYQHYGMCTRLLDLTTNPLVALYFACKKHGALEYETEGTKEEMEPFGVVFFKAAYPVLSDDVCVKIITALSKKDLDKESDVKSVFDYLISENIIGNEKQKYWMSEEHIEDFVDLLQRNYLVMPLYSNERLIKQSGAFLLPGLFGFVKDNDLSKSVITKCKKDLRDEFQETCFYIDGADKDSILEELNWYNINESTLFPELEHQLNYIKQNNRAFTKPVDVFEKYPFESDGEKQEILSTVSAEEMETFKEGVQQFVISKLGSDLGMDVFSVLEKNMIVDWYKRDSIKSKMRITVTSKIGKKVDNPKEMADEIVNYLVDGYMNLSGESQEI